MQWTRNPILAGAVLLLLTKQAQSQELGVLRGPLVEFQRACTSNERAGHFQRSGSLRYECLLPNGDTATVLTVGKTRDEIRVVGIIYETHGLLVAGTAKSMDWLSGKEGMPHELTRRSRGSDGCVFAERRGNLTTTVLLSCSRKTTIATMLRFRGNPRAPPVEDHQN